MTWKEKADMALALMAFFAFMGAIAVVFGGQLVRLQ